MAQQRFGHKELGYELMLLMRNFQDDTTGMHVCTKHNAQGKHIYMRNTKQHGACMHACLHACYIEEN